MHVRNITDVDDKTIRGAQAEKMSLKDFTQKWTQKFHDDCNALNLIAPDEEPSAVENIPEQIAMIEELVKKEHAYAAPDGSVYFKVSSFKDYGQLAHLDIENLQTQETNSGDARNLADEYERESIADFALWKSAKAEDGENAWDSPWGKGRPGWHIECSAMSRKYLGESFDLHGGGIDLTFPHHENEIAQSRCCTNCDTYAHHWFHCAHLMVESQKMSKSLGNLYTLDQLREKGHSPAAVRYALMSGHYRQPLNFTFNSLHAAKSAMEKLEKEVSKLLQAAGQSTQDWTSYTATPAIGFFSDDSAPFKGAWDKLADDLNVPACIGALFSEMPFENTDDLKRTLTGLGALLYALGIALFENEKDSVEVPEDIKQMAAQRWDAQASRDWASADSLRQALTDAGWQVKDSKESYEILPL